MKNKILKAMAYIMVFIFLLSASALDSESIIPSVTCLISVLWLLLFAVANWERIEKYNGR